MHGFVNYVDVEVCGCIGSVSQKVAWAQWVACGYKVFQSKFSRGPKIWRGSKDENVYMQTLITVVDFISLEV